MSNEVKKVVLFFLRGGFIPLFLLICFGTSYSEDNSKAVMNHVLEAAFEKNLHESYIWQSLLHATNNKLNITDPDFILSSTDFSLENELEKTIQSFFNEPSDSVEHPICRFPARFFWIKSELQLDNSIFPDVRCSEFKEYLNRAPAQKIHLVFISENVSQPSSMMGHVLLKLSGVNKNSTHVEHAVSFYTVIDTLNIPLLIAKSTITGMDGFFSLLPYNEQIKRYLEKEDRNVWEYELGLPEETKTLMYYHIWELKDLKMRYLFTGYNCATVIYNILSLGSESLSKNNDRLWITPVDVVKEAYKNNLLLTTKLIPSDKWNIRMLSDALDSDSIAYIKDLFKKKDFDRLELSEDSTKKVYQADLVISYAHYLYKQGDITGKELTSIIDRTTKATKDSPIESFYIDVSRYKSPLKTFDNTQFGIGYKMEKERDSIKLYFLPASNTLSDDNREYFNENLLKLTELSLLINSRSIKLESFQIYAMKSLIPWNVFVNGLSGEFRLGLENHYNRDLSKHLSFNASGGVGLTKKLSTDINAYIEINAGPGYGDSRFYLYFYPEVGATIYEIMNMKTTLSYKYIYNQLGSNEYYNDFDITQSVFLQKKFKLSTSFEYRFNENYSNNTFELMFHVYF